MKRDPSRPVVDLPRRRFRQNEAICTPAVLTGKIAEFDRLFETPRRFVSESNIARLGAIALGLFTAYQLTIDLIDRRSEREERRQSTIERAWTHVLTPLGGNTGKGAALNTLLQAGEPLVGADFSCERIGEWDAANKKCARIVVFAGLNWVKSDMQLPDFSNANLYQSNFDREDLSGAEFKEAIFQESSMMGADLRRYDNAIAVWRSDVSKSKISPAQLQETQESKIGGVEIMPRDTDKSFTIDTTDKMPNWSWADDPPRIVRSRLRPVSSGNVVDAQYETIQEPWDGEIILCDPRAPVVKTPKFMGRELPGGLYFLEMLNGYCKQIAFQDAKNLWPEAYRSKVRYKAVWEMIVDGEM